MSLGNGNPKEGDKGSNFDFERKSLKLLQAISDATAGGSGTVTSVGLSMPGEFIVSNSPVTTSGTLTVTKDTQRANLVYAGPTSGVPAEPSFRALTIDDLPENAKIDSFSFNGYNSGGLGAQELLILSTGNAADALAYGSFNPASWSIDNHDASYLAILDIGQRYTGQVYYELGVVLAGTISLAARMQPVIGVVAGTPGSVSQTYTASLGTAVRASSTVVESITYLSGVITYTPQTNSTIVFGLSEANNQVLCNGHIHVFGKVHFVLG